MVNRGTVIFNFPETATTQKQKDKGYWCVSMCSVQGEKKTGTHPNMEAVTPEIKWVEPEKRMQHPLVLITYYFISSQKQALIQAFSNRR